MCDHVVSAGRRDGGASAEAVGDNVCGDDGEDGQVREVGSRRGGTAWLTSSSNRIGVPLGISWSFMVAFSLLRELPCAIVLHIRTTTLLVIQEQ